MRIITALLATTFLASAAQAADQDFTLVNSTGYQIDEVYLSEVSSKAWGQDVMGKDALPNGNSVEMQFSAPSASCKWDMRVKYHDGDEAVWQNLNLCDITRVTLFWNANTQATTASVE